MKAFYYKNSITFITTHARLVGIFHKHQKNMIGRLPLFMSQEIRSIPGSVITKIDMLTRRKSTNEATLAGTPTLAPINPIFLPFHLRWLIS